MSISAILISGEISSDEITIREQEMRSSLLREN